MPGAIPAINAHVYHNRHTIHLYLGIFPSLSRSHHSLRSRSTKPDENFFDWDVLHGEGVRTEDLLYVGPVVIHYVSIVYLMASRDIARKEGCHTDWTSKKV